MKRSLNTCSGRFKEEVLASDVLTGHEFSRPLKNLPHPFVLKTATNFIGKVRESAYRSVAGRSSSARVSPRKLPPKIAQGSNIVVHTDQPHMDAILMSTSQVVRGDEPGNEPAITCRDIHEDCAVLGGAFAKGNVSSSRRKRMFSNPSRCRGLTFDTETVWTFEFYQNLFDATSYSLDLGFAKIGCSRVLDGQPIQWLGKMRDGRYLWVSLRSRSLSGWSRHTQTSLSLLYVVPRAVVPDLARETASKGRCQEGRGRLELRGVMPKPKCRKELPTSVGNLKSYQVGRRPRHQVMPWLSAHAARLSFITPPACSLDG